MRLLILVVAYNAESTVRRVLDRVPRQVLTDWDCHVLLIDDASDDETFTLGREYRAGGRLPLSVLRNGVNQGYGGNQKIGYAYALAEGFDVVALVHGDGQYAPEELPRLLEPIRTGAADVVFGSRMLTAGGARRGGMPLYKFVGNRVLSTVQNRLANADLSEWHSGYRIYSVPMLSRIPFMLNSNGFSFDTEVILQLQNASARIVELPIPTFYGDEISRVNGLRYAREVVTATASNALHRRGLLQQRRFDAGDDTDDVAGELKFGYPSSHSWAVDAVPPGASAVLIGAADTRLAGVLADRGCRVSVLGTPSDPAPDPRVRVLAGDLEALNPGLADHEYLLLLDVLAHVRRPEDFLDRLRAVLDERPHTLVVAVPNVAFLVPRLMLLTGHFNYGRMGILDSGHSRLFTVRSLRRLLVDAGCRDLVVRGVPAPFPKALGDTALARALLRLNLGLIHLSRSLFGYQIFVSAHATPGVTYLLDQARATADD